MRIVAWNCRRGPLAKKRAALADLDADIIVLSEAPRPSAPEPGVLWFGPEKLGVAIIARPPFHLTSRVRDDVPCVYPVSVTGPLKFTLLGVWTWPAPTYRKALWDGLVAYERLPQPWVVAGDFNGNVSFDRPRRKLKWQHSFDRLHDAGLRSAYHAFTGAVAGQEPVATHYFRTHPDKPFHLDYCYIPVDWIPRLEDVRIAPFEQFATLSDHRPLSITIRTS